MTRRASKLRLFFLAALIAAAGSAKAQSLGDILDCRAIENQRERLACFDETAGLAADAISNAASAIAPANPGENSGAMVAETTLADGKVGAPQAATVSPDASFGAGDLQQGRNTTEGDDEPDELRAKLVALSFTNSGRYIITLDNGQVWRQITGDASQLRLSAVEGGGVPVIIKKALFGSHRLRTAASKRMIRVERIR